MWRSLQRWRGVILIGLAVVATVWLAFGNQLVLYIHPRYIVFTVVMAVIALVFAIASVVIRSAGHDDDENPRGLPRLFGAIALGLSVLFAIAMVALPPATLSSATASQRDINSSAIGADTQSVSDADAAPAGAFATFTVVDWASLLRQTNDLDFYDGKPVDVVGFITADADDPQNVFYVSRFFITCCAVDAQPAGIPVYLANWPDTYQADQWVQATGEFGTNPSTRSTQGLALDPSSITVVEQPSEPYLY